MAMRDSRFAQAWSALFLIVFIFTGCGAIIFGLELAGSLDCTPFARFSPGGVLVAPCERFGPIAAATPFFLIGTAALVYLFVGAPRWMPPAVERPRPRQRPSRGFKVMTFLLGVGLIVDGVRMAFYAPCSDFRVPASVLYRGFGDGMATICEKLGPVLPASPFVLFGAFLLVTLFKGWPDDEP